MAFKFQIISNSIVVTDTDLSIDVVDMPKSNVYYSVKELNNGFVKLVDVSLGNTNISTVFKQPLTKCIDASDVAFNETTFKAFIRTNNLGFKTASGGSEATLENLTASGVIDIDLGVYKAVKLNFTGNGSITFSNVPSGANSVVVSIALTTATGAESVSLPSAPNYYYYGDLDLTTRNKVVCEFSSYEVTGLEVDIFQNLPNT